MKKRMIAAAFAAVLAVSLTACSGNETAPSGAGSGENTVEAVQKEEIERKDYTVVYSAELAHINYLVSSLSTCTRFTENYVDVPGLFDSAETP